MHNCGELGARAAPAWRTRIGLALILAVYVALATLQSFATRLQWGPDEPAHIVYVQSLAQDGRLPEMCHTERDCAYAPGASRSFEAQHPPLYYALAAVVWRAFAGRPDDSVWYWDQGSRQGRRFSVPGEVRPVRLLSVLLGLATLIGLWVTAQVVFPGKPALWLSAVTLTAFTPMFTYMSGVVNNDALLGVAFAATAWWWARALRFGVGWRDVWLLGILLGLGLNVKQTALGLAPASVVVLALAPGRAGRWQRAGWTAAAVALAAALGGWWFVRNALIYGSPFVYPFHYPLLGLPEPRRLALMCAMPIRVFLFTFVPVDVIIAHANMTLVSGFFVAVLVLSVVGLALVLRRRRRFSMPRYETQLLVLWLATGVVVLAGILHNLLLVDWRMGTSGGRLLMCVLPLAAMTSARGISALLGDGRLAQVGLLVICLLLLAVNLHCIFATAAGYQTLNLPQP
jgi:4-amino-4-deoxy-L-arabinose transferase-like glycosyltransferase